jgi:hypothetical protein
MVGSEHQSPGAFGLGFAVAHRSRDGDVVRNSPQPANPLKALYAGHSLKQAASRSHGVRAFFVRTHTICRRDLLSSVTLLTDCLCCQGDTPEDVAREQFDPEPEGMQLVASWQSAEQSAWDWDADPVHHRNPALGFVSVHNDPRLSTFKHELRDAPDWREQQLAHGAGRSNHPYSGTGGGGGIGELFNKHLCSETERRRPVSPGVRAAFH